MATLIKWDISMIRNNMKVLILNESLSLGGAESMSVELANALADKNIKTYFISASDTLLNRLDKKIIFYEIPKYNLFSIFKIINKLSELFLKLNQILFIIKEPLFPYLSV